MHGGLNAGLVMGGQNGFILIERDQHVTDLQVELVGAAADGQVAADEMQGAGIGGIGSKGIEIDGRGEFATGGGAQGEPRLTELKHLTLPPAAGQSVGTGDRILVPGNPQSICGIDDLDTKHLFVEAGCGVGHADRDGVAAVRFVVQQCTIDDGDEARIEIDGKASARIVGQRVRQCIAIGIGAGYYADGRSIDGIFVDLEVQYRGARGEAGTGHMHEVQIVAADGVGHHTGPGKIAEGPIGNQARFAIGQRLPVMVRDFADCANIIEDPQVIHSPRKHIDGVVAAQDRVLVLSHHQLAGSRDGLPRLITGKGLDLLTVNVKNDRAIGGIPGDAHMVAVAVEQLRILAGGALVRRTWGMDEEPNGPVVFNEQRQFFVIGAISVGEERCIVGCRGDHREGGLDGHCGQPAEQAGAIIGDKSRIVTAVGVQAQAADDRGRCLQVIGCRQQMRPVRGNRMVDGGSGCHFAGHKFQLPVSTNKRTSGEIVRCGYVRAS